MRVFTPKFFERAAKVASTIVVVATTARCENKAACIIICPPTLTLNHMRLRLQCARKESLAILASSLVAFRGEDRFRIGAGNFAHRDPANAAYQRAD